MNFLHASQNESMFMAMEGPTLVQRKPRTVRTPPSQTRSSPPVHLLLSRAAVPGTSSGRCCYP